MEVVEDGRGIEEVEVYLVDVGEEGGGPGREPVDGLRVVRVLLIDLEEAEQQRGSVQRGEAAALGDEILDGVDGGGPDGPVGALAQGPAEEDARTPAGQHHAYFAEVVAVAGEQGGGEGVEEGFHWGKVGYRTEERFAKND